MRRSPSVLDIVRIQFAELVASFHALAMFLVVLVVAIPIFVITGLGLVGLTSVIGATGTLAAVLSILWFVIFIGGTAVVVRRIVRGLRPVTSKVESLADLELADGARAQVADLTSFSQRPIPPPASSTGDPLIADEVRRWRENQRR